MMSPVGWVGLSLFVVALAFIWREHRNIRRSQIVRGEVFAKPRGSIRGKAHVPGAPEVVFETADGNVVLLHGKLDPADGARFEHSGVGVAYFPDRPQQARVLLFSYRYAFWFAVAAFGVWLMSVDYGFRRGDELIRHLYVTPSDARE